MIRIFSQYVSPKGLVQMAVESVLISCAFFCGARLRFWNDEAGFLYSTALPDFAVQCGVAVVILQLCCYYNDLYAGGAARHRREEFMQLGQSLGAACLVLGFIYLAIPSLLVGRGIFTISIAMAALFLALSRITVDRIWRAAPSQNVLVLGTGELALAVAREITAHGDLGMRLVGFVAEKPLPAPAPPTLRGYPILAEAARLEDCVAAHKASTVVVALNERRGLLPVRELVRLRTTGVRVEDAHSTMAAMTGRVWLTVVQPSWFIFSEGFRRSRITVSLKRMLDLALGFIGLFLSAPLMAVIAAAIRLDSRGPAIYRQTRVGMGGRCFEVLKFRSMRTDSEAGGAVKWAAENDPRVTRVGRILRKYRFDELPQFLNIIRGDMSFVGPRPERPVFVEQLRREIPYYDERHSVRPGLTGWAQTQYPYGATVEDARHKLEYDLFYLKNMSLLFDCAIVIQTVRIVLFGQNRH